MREVKSQKSVRKKGGIRENQKLKVTFTLSVLRNYSSFHFGRQ